MQTIKFKNIKHKFPKESWIYSRNEKNNGEFEEENILYIEGDYETGNLDLDVYFTIEKTYMSILVEGNLTTKNIFNKNTDGAPGLIVLGNVVVNNMIVGGQDIYVTGNLTVHECFWGDYNHGDLIVEGNTNAYVFVATDEYHYDYKKERITANHFLCDDDEEDEEQYERDKIAKFFLPEMLMEEKDLDEDELYSWNEWLRRNDMLAALQQGKPILKTKAEILAATGDEDAYEKIFTYNAITNLQQLQGEAINFIKLFNEVVNLCAEDMQEYERNGWNIKFEKDGTTDNIPLITATNVNGYAFAILLEEKETKSLFRKKTVQYLSAGFSDPEDKSGEIFKEQSNDTCNKMFVSLWHSILKDAELGAHYYKQFHQIVDVPKAYSWFSLPIVTEPEAEKLFYEYEEVNDEWRGFWRGSYQFYFRPENEETQNPAILQIAGKISAEDEFDTRSYRFWFDEMYKPTKVLLKYNSSQEGKYNDRYQSIDGAIVFPFDWEKYKEAIYWYGRAEKLIIESNKSYLEDKEEDAQNNKPLIERDAAKLLKDFADELFLSDKLFGNRVERLTYGNYFKETEKQFVSFEHLSLSANVIWNEDKSIGYGFNEQEGRFTQLVIIITENGKTDAPELFIYHYNKEQNLIYCYHLPEGETIDSKDFPKYVITEATEKTIIVSLIEQFHACQNFLDAQEDKLKDTANRRKVFTKPYETVTIDGIVFKVIDIHEAHEIIKDITDFQGNQLYDVYDNGTMFPLYEDNPFFLLAEEDVEAEAFSLDFSTDECPDIFILGFIFLKNLTTAKYVEGHDIDVSPVMIVLGKVHTNNLMVLGNVHYIGNGLDCGIIWGFYNHGNLYVKGETEANLIYADDMKMYFEKLAVAVAVSDLCGTRIFTTADLPQEDGTFITHEYNVINTHKLSAIVADQYVHLSKYGEERISDDGSGEAFDIMMQGESIIDWNKKERVMYKGFQAYFETRLQAILALPAFKEKGYVEWKSENGWEHYFVSNFIHEGTRYIQVVRNFTWSNTITTRIVFAEGTKDYQLDLIHYNKDNTVKLYWESKITDNSVQARAVKCAMMELFDIFLGKDENQKTETNNNANEQPENRIPDLYFYEMAVDIVTVSQKIKLEIKALLKQAFENPKSFYDEDDEFILSERGLTYSEHSHLTAKFVFTDKLIEANQMAEVDWKEDEENIRFSINRILKAKNVDYQLFNETKYGDDTFEIIQLINDNELKPAGYVLELLDIDSDSYVFTIVPLSKQQEVATMFLKMK